MAKKNNPNDLRPEQFEDETILIIVKHKGKLYVKGQRIEVDDERGLHNTLVAIDKLAYASQRTLFYDPEFGKMPQNKLFDLEANVEAGESWIIDKPDTIVGGSVDFSKAINKEAKRRARKKGKGKS